MRSLVDKHSLNDHTTHYSFMRKYQHKHPYNCALYQSHNYMLLSTVYQIVVNLNYKLMYNNQFH